MTAPEMNAYLAKKTIGLLALAAPVGGCAGAFEATTDPTSAAAPRVQALVDANRAYPAWSDFPQASTEAPAPVEVAARVNTLRATGGALAGEASRIEWTLGDPADLARDIAARIDSRQISPVTAETQAEVERFAAETRRRGAAPPPVDRAPIDPATPPR